MSDITSSPPTSPRRTPPGVTLAVGAMGTAFVVALTLYLAGAPTFTNDFWFHLKMGEVYASEGLWPDADPMLHTALPEAPVQHEWLFGVMLSVVNQATGFFGIRLFHLLMVVGSLVLVYRIARRTSGSALAACLGTSVFCVLAWTRLYQLRPDLMTIAATLGVFALLMEVHRVATPRRLLGFGVLMVVWANAHSLFALAPLLLFAAGLALGVRAVGEAHLLEEPGRTDALLKTRRVALSVALAIVIASVVSLLNPRGIEQHLTFFTSSSDTAIWAVKDEWSRFDPFDPKNHPGSVSALLWFTMNCIIAMFAVTTFVGVAAVVRRRSRSLEIFDPVLFGVGLASIVAILVSVRFLWLGIFPLLFVTRALSRADLRRDSREIVSWAIAIVTLLVSIQFYRISGYEMTAARLPDRFADYVSTPYLTRKFYIEGTQFLRDTGVEGRLFNDYGKGGFLGYWLSPRLSTFIDSRTEHYPPNVMSEYSRITRVKELGGRRTFLDILDRRSVDFFFGIGMPVGLLNRAGGSTTSHLEGIPGWIVVSRSLRHAIYMRDVPRNDGNFTKIEQYYEGQGVPFDRQSGFDVATVFRANKEWSIRHGLLTEEQAQRIAQRESADKNARASALDTLAWVYALGGSYEEALDVEDELSALKSPSKAALRRDVYSSLKLGRVERAKRSAAELVRRFPREADSLVFKQLVVAYAEVASVVGTGVEEAAGKVALARITQRIPLLSPLEVLLLERGMPGNPRVN